MGGAKGLGALPAIADFVHLVARAKLTGRSYWIVRFADGRIINETQCDWSHLPYHGRQAVRLVCPNGQVAELGRGGNAEGRFFQLKEAVVDVGPGRRRRRGHVLSHIIGLIDGLNGEAQCARWDYRTQQLITWRDNAYQMEYGHIGCVSSDHLGIAAA